MFFHSPQFLLFLGVTFAVYWSVHRHTGARLFVLLAASFAFYLALPPPLLHLVYALLLIAWCALVDWICARGIERTTVQWVHKALLGLSVLHNLAVLCVFKYADLFYKTAAELLGQVGVTVRYAPLGLLLPIGLSFVVFRGISLMVDIYRGELRGHHTYPEHLLYLLFFPNVISGPIVRAEETLLRFREVPMLTPDDGAQALYRIAMGLAKKLLIADVLANQLVDRVFENPAIYTSTECVVAAVAYTFEIYCDFSAYSDMAIGIARLFGFHYPENFNKPYLAKNLFEFWNRWHISLSTWLRDYLYIPLGGNRGSKLSAMVNVQIVMLLGGLWHGADWRFALWGMIHGAGLAITRLWWFLRKTGKRKEYTLLGAAMGMAGTFAVVVATRIFFRATDVGRAVDIFRQIGEGTLGVANVSELAWYALAAAVATHFLPQRLYDRTAALFAQTPVPLRAAFFVALALVLRQVAAVEVRPYIYAQF